MKIFVGTMHSREGDFADCVNAIKKQRGVEIEHFIVHNLPELEAHQRLFGTWIDVQHRYDGFVKVDSDTVLKNENVISTVFDIMKKNDASSAQVRLHDYYTDSLINGLNFFTKDSVFTVPTDALYCDRCVVHRKVIHSDDGSFEGTDLIHGAGLHCHYSTEKQAFHYGVHRGLKNRWNERDLVQVAYNRHNDPIRRFVLEGFEASERFRGTGTFNYTDKFFQDEFKKAVKKLNG